MADITTPVPLSQIIDRVGNYPAERKARWLKVLEAAAEAGLQEEAEELGNMLWVLDNIASYHLLMDKVQREALLLTAQKESQRF